MTTTTTTTIFLGCDSIEINLVVRSCQLVGKGYVSLKNRENKKRHTLYETWVLSSQKVTTLPFKVHYNFKRLSIENSLVNVPPPEEY